MKVISFVNSKGGVGKTTLATNISVMFAKSKKKILLIDADQQGSSVDFRGLRADNESVAQFPVTQILTPTIHKDIHEFAFDYVIVDVGGRDNKIFRSAVMASDFVIVPLCPSQYDFWGSQQTFETLQEARLTKPDLKVFSVLNMVIPGTKIAREIESLIKDFETEYEIEFLKSRLNSRIAYKYSVSEGLGVIELSNVDDKAAKEIKQFYKELNDKIKQNGEK
jgi:chromosome partitioning protein